MLANRQATHSKRAKWLCSRCRCFQKKPAKLSQRSKMIVVAPTDRWLKTALQDCSSSLAVSSPSVGKYLHDVVSQLGPNVAVTVLTLTLLGDYDSNASNLDALHALADRIGGI